MDLEDIFYDVLEWISPWALFWFNAGLVVAWLLGHMIPFFNRDVSALVLGLVGFAIGFQNDYRRRDYANDLAVVGHLALALIVIGAEAALVIGVLRSNA